MHQNTTDLTSFYELAHGEGLYSTALFYAEGGDDGGETREVERIASLVARDYIAPPSPSTLPAPRVASCRFALIASLEVVRRLERRSRA